MIAFVAIGDHVIGEADVGGSTGIEQRIDGALWLAGVHDIVAGPSANQNHVFIRGHGRVEVTRDWLQRGWMEFRYLHTIYLNAKCIHRYQMKHICILY